MRSANSIYMIGIGGIGMSALAQLLVHQGKVVSGSDREESPTVQLLGEKGIHLWVGHDECNIPAGTELVIYSDAVPVTNIERVRAEEMGIRQVSYFEMLGSVSASARTIAVAGTHGKTTTTGMLASILKDAGKQPTAIIGSIVRDFGLNRPFGAVGRTPGEAKPRGVSGSNFLAGRDNLFVVEACEYRDHLLELSPEILVITNIELDHTDFFPSLSALQNTFRIAAEKVPAYGAIVTDPNHPNIAPILSHVRAKVIDYTHKAVGSLQLIGEFNRENARAALAAALAAEPTISQEAAIHTLSQFKGSWRRFEFKGETPNGALVYDDYAHHPTAVRKTIEAARQKFPDKKVIVAFHPHLFSRTRDLMDDFAKALATADNVILAPIFAARENPIDGVSSDILAQKITSLGTSAHAFASLHDVRVHLTETSNLTPETLLITMGAGDIYKIAQQLVIL